MKNLNQLGDRKEADILKAFYGLETAYDDSKKQHCVKAVFETQAGKAVMLGSEDVMALMMEHQMSMGRVGLSAQRRDLLEAEQALVSKAHDAQHLPNMNTAIFASNNPARLTSYTYSVENFPQGLQAQVSSYLQRFTLKPGGTA